MSAREELKQKIDTIPDDTVIVINSIIDNMGDYFLDDIMDELTIGQDYPLEQIQEGLAMVDKYRKKIDLPEDFDWKEDKYQRLVEKYGPVN